MGRASNEEITRLWAELRLWYPAQTREIAGDKTLKRALFDFFKGYQPGVLAVAWKRIQARPTVYASESIPALFTQAIGDAVAEQVGTPAEFEAWARRAIGNPEVEDNPPREAFAAALRECPTMFDLKRTPTEFLAKALEPGKAYLAKLAQISRLRAAEAPRSVSLDGGALALPPGGPEVSQRHTGARELPERPERQEYQPKGEAHANPEAAAEGLAKIRALLGKVGEG